MPQNPTNITDSTEFKNFCKSNNLEIFNLEAINVALYTTFNYFKEISGAFFSHYEALTKLEEENNQIILSQEEIINDYKKRIKKLEEMILEIASHIKDVNINEIQDNGNI